MFTRCGMPGQALPAQHDLARYSNRARTILIQAKRDGPTNDPHESEADLFSQGRQVALSPAREGLSVPPEIARRIIPALDEAFRIGREAKIPVEIWHLKAAGKPNWGRMPEIVAHIEVARCSGVDVCGARAS